MIKVTRPHAEPPSSNDTDGQTEPELRLNSQPKTGRFYNTKHLAGTLSANIIGF